MKVAFLDSGIDVSHPVFAGVKITQRIYYEGLWVEQEYQPVQGHGTGVASILVKHAAAFEITSFVLFTQELRVDMDRYISVLEHILYEDSHYDIIHMSLSVRSYNHKLERLCKSLYQKGSVLVGAFDNSGYISYPAAFSAVIGVDASIHCQKSSDYISLNGPVDLLAKGGSQRVAWLNHGYMVMQGSSFAAAYISAHIIQAIQKGISLKTIFPLCSCFNTQTVLKAQEFLLRESIRKAIVFPYNKETTSLLRFSDLLSFELADVYDTKLSGNLGRTIACFDGKRYTVKNIDNCDFDTFDTFIMGHTHDLEYASKQEIRKPLIEQCIQKQKNLFCFDDELIDGTIQSRFIQAGVQVCYPTIDHSRVSEKFGKLYYIKTPVLGIFGTSSQQGKYTLQLYLRKRFLQSGYTVGQLGSEPESQLFGMNEVFPYGYRGMTLSGYKSIEYLNQCMADMDKKEYDLIIVGSQSGTIPMQYSCLNVIPLEGLNFLLGTRPDAVILCVNYHDTVADIKRTIYGIESLAKTKVIACSVFPLGYATQWDMMRGAKRTIDLTALEAFIRQISQDLSIPCYSTDVQGTDALYQASIDFFGSVKP